MDLVSTSGYTSTVSKIIRQVEILYTFSQIRHGQNTVMVHSTGSQHLIKLLLLLLLNGPVVQNTHAHVQVRREAGPHGIGNQHQSRGTIVVPQGPDQRRHIATQQDEIRQGKAWLPEGEKQRHPEEVEDKLRAEQGLRSGGPLLQSRRGGVGQRSHRSRHGGMVDGVAHGRVQEGPDGREDPDRRVEGRLTQGSVFALRAAATCRRQ